MKCDKAEVWLDNNADLDLITLWDVTVDDDGNVTGTYVIDDDFPRCKEVVTVPSCDVYAFFGEDFT